jgi:hypothetical protein
MEQIANENVGAVQARVEEAAGAPEGIDIAGLDDIERHLGDMDRAAEVGRQGNKTLILGVGVAVDGGVACTPVFGHGPRDGVVKAAVQATEIIRADLGVGFERRLGDGLTDVAVFVDDLGDREPLREEVVAVLNGGLNHGVVAHRRVAFQFSDELVEERGSAVVELHVRARGDKPGVGLFLTARDDVGAIGGDELCQHDAFILGACSDRRLSYTGQGQELSALSRREPVAELRRANASHPVRTSHLCGK